MENNELLTKVFQQYGISGLLVIFLVYKHYVEPKKEEKVIEKKKQEGTYISFDDVKELKETVKNHLFEEAKEDIRAAKLESRVDGLETKVVTEHGHLFSQHKVLFEKLDKLDDKIDQRFLVINEDIKQILAEMKK